MAPVRRQDRADVRKVSSFGPSKRIPVLFRHSLQQPRMGRDSIALGVEPWVAIQQQALALKGRDSNGDILPRPKGESRPVGAF